MQLLILNKIDLLPYVPFDEARFLENARQVNPAITVVRVSATRGDGLDGWYDWLRDQTGCRGIESPRGARACALHSRYDRRRHSPWHALQGRGPAGTSSKPTGGGCSTCSPTAGLSPSSEGSPVGTVMTSRFGPVAWVAMMLVEERFRGRGIGRALMVHALSDLDARAIRSVRLDATPLGRPLYESLGFIAETTYTRFEGTLPPAQPIADCRPAVYRRNRCSTSSATSIATLPAPTEAGFCAGWPRNIPTPHGDLRELQWHRRDS